LLQRGLHDHFGSLADAGVNYLEARVAQGPNDHLRASVMAVQARLGDQNAMGYGHEIAHPAAPPPRTSRTVVMPFLAFSRPSCTRSRIPPCRATLRRPSADTSLMQVARNWSVITISSCRPMRPRN